MENKGKTSLKWHTARIIMISFIIGSTIYSIEFYKKENELKDKKAIIEMLKKIDNTAKNQKRLKSIPTKKNETNYNKNKTKREIWEKYIGMACKEDKKDCKYYFEVTERNCWLATNKCHVTRKEVVKKEKKYEKYNAIWI
mgnify:CR=1 FL=1